MATIRAHQVSRISPISFSASRRRPFA